MDKNIYNFPFCATEDEPRTEPISQASSRRLFPRGGRGGGQRGSWGRDQHLSPQATTPALPPISQQGGGGRKRGGFCPPPTTWQITPWDLGIRAGKEAEEAGRGRENETGG